MIARQLPLILAMVAVLLLGNWAIALVCAGTAIVLEAIYRGFTCVGDFEGDRR